jgi:hypothetical protein
LRLVLASPSRAQAAKLNAKAGPFAALLCVGNFFDPDGYTDELVPYLDGKLTVPVPTYFITAGEVGVSVK